jgi:hypothetical protein
MGLVRDYLFLLGLIFVPGAVVGAVTASSIQGAASRYTNSRVLRIAIAAAALALWALLTSWVGPVLLGEPAGGIPNVVGLAISLSSSAVLPFCILLPWIAVTAYVLRSAQPVWWKAGLLGSGAVIGGAALWLALGIAFGAATN